MKPVRPGRASGARASGMDAAAARGPEAGATSSRESEADVVVIGAGPAGSMAAREAARRGASVVLVERAPFPRWKVCGGCVGPRALEVLASVGLAELSARWGASLLRCAVVHAGTRSASFPLGPFRVWRREELDHALLLAAARAGAAVRQPARASVGPVRGGRRTVRIRSAGCEERVRARIVLDAAGLGGAPAEDAGRTSDARRVSAESRVGLGAVVDGVVRLPGGARLGPGRVHLAVGPSGYVGAVLLGRGTVGLAAALEPGALREADGPGDVVRDTLAGSGLRIEGDVRQGWRGTPPLTQAPALAAEERLLRIGDAMGYVEPFTGEGIGWALESGRDAAAVALGRGGVVRDEAEELWRAHHERHTGAGRHFCRVVAWGVRRPVLTAGALALVARLPALAHRVGHR